MQHLVIRTLLRSCAILFAGCMLMIAQGCGGRDSAPVSGMVTLNGEPQEGIFVYFEPQSASGKDVLNVGSKSYARTDSKGRYTLNFMDADKDRPGALVGKHTVSLDDERTFGAGAPDEMGGRKPLKSRVPRGWSAKFAVPAEGTTEANFELSASTPNG